VVQTRQSTTLVFSPHSSQSSHTMASSSGSREELLHNAVLFLLDPKVKESLHTRLSRCSAFQRFLDLRLSQAFALEKRYPRCQRRLFDLWIQEEKYGIMQQLLWTVMWKPFQPETDDDPFFRFDLLTLPCLSSRPLLSFLPTRLNHHTPWRPHRAAGRTAST
jgi:hypothetical protein